MNPTHNFRTDIALTRYTNSRELWDTPLFESTSFVALPTVGALVEGWLLVVPRMHALSYAQISDQGWCEAEDFLREVSHRVEAEYGPVAIFEHGPGTKQSPIGCGVDYAHFHVVPTRVDLRARAVKNFPSVTWQPRPSLGCIKSYRDCRTGYWAIMQNEYSRDCWIGTTSAENSPNQLFRRVLADSNNVNSSEFDWRADPREDLILATVDRLTNTALHE